jgi:hypothetical protein
MKQFQKSNQLRGLVRVVDSASNKEVVPASQAAKPVYSASRLKIMPARTAADIRRAIAEGRVAEMTPDLAG